MEVRPYRLVEGDIGRFAVLEVRCGQVLCLECDHPRHVAADTPDGMTRVVGRGWMTHRQATRLFWRMVDDEEHYGEMLR
jgi:hypothetical protein